MQMIVRPAQAADLHRVAQLFDSYRQFYQQAPDPALAERFIAARLANNDSVILVASVAAAEPVGFAQLYPTLCSVSAAPIYVLYDLFVAQPSRRQGAARALLEAARAHAMRTGAVRLELATARTNLAAQALYESLGWQRDEEFYRYALAVQD
jgi:ribosomal protein S18 acetylase RimI-like enzyme